MIREDGPDFHKVKTGTPTMAGSAFLPAALVAGLYGAQYSPCAVLVAVSTLLFGLLGLVDDLLILGRGSSRGIPALPKLLAQFAIAAFVCYGTYRIGPYTPYDAIPLFDCWCLWLGPLYWALSGLTLVAESNAVNLTDGLDGLAGGAAALAFGGMALALSRGTPSLVPMCAALAGACVAFLTFNRRPARIFMGNTGALALGGALGALAVVSKMFLPLLLVSGVFVLEAASVVLQVGFYKVRPWLSSLSILSIGRWDVMGDVLEHSAQERCSGIIIGLYCCSFSFQMTKGPDGKGKRLFRMAPFHHHLELGGMSEDRVVQALLSFGAVCAFLGALQGLSAPIVVV